VEPADDLAGRRIADKNRQRAEIVVSGLAEIVADETIGNDRYVGGIRLIDNGDAWFQFGIVIRHIFASDGSVPGFCLL
jgi:hypothetical protein